MSNDLVVTPKCIRRGEPSITHLNSAVTKYTVLFSLVVIAALSLGQRVVMGVSKT